MTRAKMSNGEILPTEGSRRYSRPLGIWALTVGNFVVVGLILVTVLQVVIYPNENWNSASRIAAPYILALTLVIEISTIGAWLGNPYARIAMLVSLSLLTVAAVMESVAGIGSWLPFIAKVGDVPLSRWWEPSVRARLVLWLGINCWYFLLGSQARRFYSSR
jgi:hypothetical protein